MRSGVCCRDDSFAEFLQLRTQCKRSSCGERSEVQIRLLIIFSPYILISCNSRNITHCPLFMFAARRITHVGLSLGCMRATDTESEKHSTFPPRHLSLALLFPVALCVQQIALPSLALLTTRIIAAFFSILLVCKRFINYATMLRPLLLGRRHIPQQLHVLHVFP